MVSWRLGTWPRTVLEQFWCQYCGVGGILAEIMAEMWSIVVYCGELRSMCGEVWSRNVGYCGGGGDGVLGMLYKIIDGRYIVSRNVG